MGSCCVTHQQTNILVDLSQTEHILLNKGDSSKKATEDLINQQNDNAILIQSFYRGYYSRKQTKQFQTIVVQAGKLEIPFESDSIEYIPHSEITNKQTPPVVMKQNARKKSFSQDQFEPRVACMSDLSLSNTQFNIPELSLKVQEALQNYGAFDYEEYLVKQSSQFYNSSTDDQNLPFLEPYKMANGNIYMGQWRQGKRQGKGRYIWTDGNLFEGFWNNGSNCGIGRLIYFNGDVFIGDWNLGQTNGQGQYTHADGSIQKGEWKNNQQHGQGEEMWIDGTIYKGQYKEGKKNGFGIHIWPDESLYEGHFINNMFHGYGNYKWKDLREYKGEWFQNKMHGYGSFTWPDGRKYSGEYQFDIKNGFGKFRFKDKSIYKGLWENGKMHGNGSLTSPQSDKKLGIWYNGKHLMQ